MLCLKCKKEIQEGVEFCGNCGSHLIWTNGDSNGEGDKVSGNQDKKDKPQSDFSIFIAILVCLIIVGGFIYACVTDEKFRNQAKIMGIVMVIVVIYLIFKLPGIMDKLKLKENYDKALKNLAKEPTNISLRVEALNAGRAYYSNKRNDKKLTIYDEQAIQNDLAPYYTNSNKSANSNEGNNVYKDIEELAKLKDKGILTEDEFNEKKRVLLAKITK